MCAVYATFRSPMLPKQAQTAKFRGIISTLAQWLACWAHNPKVRGSKPRSAISMFAFPILVPSKVFPSIMTHP